MPLWRFQPLADYRCPEMPPGESFRTKLRHGWKRLVTLGGDDDRPKHDFDDLPTGVSAHLVPEMHWPEAVETLDELLQQRRSEGASALVLVGPPGSRLRKLIGRWTEHAQAESLAPPDNLLHTSEFELDAIREETERPLVIAALEAFYCRSPAGLILMRRLVEAMRVSPRPLVVGCDSWAWAFLGKAVQIDALLPRPYTLAPLSGRDCCRWLGERCREAGCQFRFAEGEEDVFPCGDADGPVDGDEQQEDRGGEQDDPFDSPEQERFFDRLASMARGIPEVAAELWKSCLREVRGAEDESQDKSEGESKEESEGESGDRQADVSAENCPAEGRVVWVQRSALGDLPVVPANAPRLDLIVLHCLLLHRELSGELLARLLPFDGARVARSLYALRRRALVVEHHGQWSVSLLAYSNVRSHLRSEGFLIDSY